MFSFAEISIVYHLIAYFITNITRSWYKSDRNRLVDKFLINITTDEKWELIPIE